MAGRPSLNARSLEALGAARLAELFELPKDQLKVLSQVLSEVRQAADLICPEALQGLADL